MLRAHILTHQTILSGIFLTSITSSFIVLDSKLYSFLLGLIPQSQALRLIVGEIIILSLAAIYWQTNNLYVISKT